MSAYILYQNQTIPEKWGGGLWKSTASRYMLRDLHVVEVVARPTTELPGLFVPAPVDDTLGYCPIALCEAVGKMPEERSR